MKNGKRILIQKVTIKHELDTDPDTSWIGEYSARPENEFSIDRATGSFQGDIDAGQKWLDRAASHLEDMRDTVGGEDATYTAEWDDAIHGALNTLDEIKDSEPFDNVSWDSRSYRYFNPGTVEDFKLDAEWIPANLKTKEEREAYWQKSMRENALADYKRMEALNNGDFNFLGVSATAEVWNPKTHVVQTIHAGGLWGIESDSDAAYLKEIESEQLAELKTELTALGFSKRAIAKAFQNIERKDS